MKIAVVGAGGVGGYFGGLLALAGHPVTLIARGRHLEALRRQGLRVHSPQGDFEIRPALATGDPVEAGPQEYVVVALKAFQLAPALPALRPLVGPETTIVPLLNGVEAPAVLAGEFGPVRVVGGLCSIVSSVESPGVIRQESALRRVVIGELDHRPSQRVERLLEAWRAAGVEAIQADDIQSALWTKFVFIAAFGGVSALARATAGELLGLTETHLLLAAAMREVEAVGRAEGVALKPDVVPAMMSLLASFEPTTTSSMQRDVAEGRPFELEAFSGTVVRIGRRRGVATPVHETLYSLLRPLLTHSHRAA